MHLDPEQLSGDMMYRWLTGVVVPRPVAWITTLSSTDEVNVAPFSFYTCLASHPPLLGVTVMRRNGRRKDTARNAISRGEFVINVVTESTVAQANATSIDAPPDYDEAAAAGLSLSPSQRVKVPGLAVSPVRLECRLQQVLEFGESDGRTHPTTFLVGQVVWLWVDDAVTEVDAVSASKLQAVGRMGGPYWSTTRDLLRLERPRYG